jgi:hypothetical protein
MIKIFLGIFILLGSQFFMKDIAEAGKSKCSIVGPNARFRCYYDWKKKKSKLRTWARRYCKNIGYKDIKDVRYSKCNKKKKKCRGIAGQCDR